MTAQPKPSSLAAQVVSQAQPKSTPKPAPPPQVLAMPSSELAAWDSGCRAAVSGLRNALCAVAYYGARMEAADRWQELGYDDVDAYRQSLGLSESYWRLCVKLGQRLGHLTLDEMRQLTMTAAESLAKVNPRLWDEYAWVDEARMLAPKDFAQLVIKRNLDANPSVLREPRVTMGLSIPESQRRPLELRLEAIRKRIHAKSSSEVVMVALDAAERESDLVAQLRIVQSQVEALAESWGADLRESPEEKEARMESGQPSVASTILQSRRLTQAILKSIREIAPSAPDPETLPE